MSDAKSFQDYLTANLGVPGEHIQLLLDVPEPKTPKIIYPSRANIIATLVSLINNPEIKEGDNIIIYYAGHGSSYECSEYDDVDEISFASSGYIEALCPIDRDTDAKSNTIPDISDREFNTILALISRAKGHHITVILDCCHSAGGSRDVPPPGARTCRGTTRATLRDMLHAGEKNLRDIPGCSSILAKDWFPDEESHVVLAACKEYQFAKERRVDGVEVGIFTHSLLRLLRSGYCNAETKYTDLLPRFDQSFSQTPVVAGKHRDARLWYGCITQDKLLITG